MEFFQLCDFWAIYREEQRNGILVVQGALADGKLVTAYFRPKAVPKGDWIAFRVEKGNGDDPSVLIH